MNPFTDSDKRILHQLHNQFKAGWDGAQGPVGPPGTGGIDGAQGIQGIEGPPGVNGIDGPVGPQGPVGPSGTNGIDGTQGIQGDPGPVGPAGADGAQGIQGPYGPAGADGVDGVDGIQGPAGPAGTDGVDGVDGIQGIEGPPGVDGNGIDGAVGPQGPAGPAGADGVNGVDGIDGIDGAQVDLFRPIHNAVFSTATANGFVTGYFTLSKQSNCLFNFSGTAYWSGPGLRRLWLSVEGAVAGGPVLYTSYTDQYVNATNIHAIFSGVGVTTLPSGDYSVTLRATGYTDSNDFGSCSVVAVQGNGSTPNALLGDTKYGYQTIDHQGWVKLDGRSKSSLSATQQQQATNLGIGVNLPDAADKYVSQVTSGVLGDVDGNANNSVTLAQANLPNVTLGGSTTSGGAHTHTMNLGNGFAQPGGGLELLAPNNIGAYVFGTSTSGAHSHTLTTSSINSGVTQTQVSIKPRTMKLNMFIFLGD